MRTHASSLEQTNFPYSSISVICCGALLNQEDGFRAPVSCGYLQVISKTWEPQSSLSSNGIELRSCPFPFKSSLSLSFPGIELHSSLVPFKPSISLFQRHRVSLVLLYYFTIISWLCSQLRLRSFLIIPLPKSRSPINWEWHTLVGRVVVNGLTTFTTIM